MAVGLGLAGTGRCVESPYLETAESRIEYSRIKKLPPDQREKAMQEFKEKHRFGSTEKDSANYEMSAKDRAEYERIKKLPPKDRDQASQDYREKNAGAFRNRKGDVKEAPKGAAKEAPKTPAKATSKETPQPAKK